MKRFEIEVSGRDEEAIALEIMKGIYGAMQSHEYCDVSVHTESRGGNAGQIEVPAFMQRKAETGSYSSVRKGRG